MIGKKPAVLLAAMLVALAMLVAGCGSDENEGAQSGAQGTATEAATQDSDAGEQDGETEAEREKEAEEAKGAGDKSCESVGDLDGSPKQEFPADLPLPGDAHVYESEGPFGKTTRYFAVIDGEADQLPATRDDASDVLVENGYKLLSKDEEAGAEAEAHLSGKHTVDIQVINLCEGKLRIRYTVS
jgi:hypothetical protein